MFPCLPLSSMVAASAALCEVCEETFAVRRQHGWPPSVMVHAQWTEPLERMAREIGLPMADAQGIVAHVKAYVDAIVAA